MRLFVDRFNQLAFDLLGNYKHSRKPNTVLVYGPEGVGKTTLIKHFFFQERTLEGFIYIDALAFSKQYIYSLQNNSLNLFRKKYRNADTLIIDHIENLTGKEKNLEELLNTVKDVLQKDGQIIVVLKGDLAKLEFLGTKFSSLLLSGLVLPVKALNQAETLRFIEIYLIEKHIIMEREAQIALAGHAPNLRAVVRLISHFLAFAEDSGNALTLECFKHFWDKENLRNSLTPTSENILSAVTSLTGVSAEYIKGNKRTKKILEARQLAVYALRTLSLLTYSEIGRYINREHGSIIQAFKQGERNVIDCKEFREQYQIIKERFVK